MPPNQRETKIPNTIDRAFADCSGLESVTIGSGVTSIGSSTFRGCSGLTGELKIPDGVTSIGNKAFAGCSGLTGELKIPDGVTSIGEWTFSGCSGLTSITIPDSVSSIGGYAFVDCSGLTSITIPDSVTSIGVGAFYGCSELESVTIGSGVTSIEEEAFYRCNALKTVYYKGTAEEWGNISIDSYHNSPLTSVTRYYFTEDKPTAEEWESHDYWWHYDPKTNKPTPWIKEEQ